MAPVSADRDVLRRSIILRFLEFVLSRSRWLFPYDYLVRRFPRTPHAAGELYVLGCLALVASAFLAIPFDAPVRLFVVVLCGCTYRLLDIYLTQLRIVLVDAAQVGYPGILSPRRSLVLSIVNFFELIIVSAFAYRTIERCSDSPAFAPSLTAKVDAFYLSVSTATAGGFADFAPQVAAAKIAMAIEVLLALVLLVLVLGLFLSSMPRIRTQDHRGE